MSLSSNWTPTTLGKLATYINGRGFKKSEWATRGVPIIRIQNLTESSNKVNYFSGSLEDKHKVSSGDLLLSWAATLDVFEFREPIGALNQHIFKVEPASGVDKYFLYYLLKHKISELYAQTHGSGMVHITAGKFKNTPALLPKIEEQEKIVAKIEELLSDIDNGIDRLRRARLVSEAHYQSALKMLLLGGASSQISSSALDELQVSIDKETPIKHKNITIDKGFDLPDLNNGWRWTTLGRVVKSVSYGSSRKSLSEGKIPVIRMGNLQNGEIEWGDLKFSSNSEEINKYLLSPGDVLFNRTNSPELVGKAALYKGERDAIYAGYLIKIEVAKAISPEYLNYFLQSSIAKHYGNLMKTDGVNQSNINSQKLLSYPFPLTTRVEQDRIVELLDTVKTNTDAIRSDIEIRIEQALRLKQSILAKAFKGELV